MERKIHAYKNYFIDFINSLSDIESKKVFYVLDMLKWLPEEVSKDTSQRNRTSNYDESNSTTSRRRKKDCRCNTS